MSKWILPKNVKKTLVNLDWFHNLDDIEKEKIMNERLKQAFQNFVREKSKISKNVCPKTGN